MEEEERDRKRIRIAIVLCFVAAALAIGIGAALLAFKGQKNSYENVPQINETTSIEAASAEDGPWWDVFNLIQLFEP
ncbi:MAG: hypothetical protein LBC69_01570 [Eubacteriaceae bacterium]|jgi:hypothetical protein|nr:hypothetical protein [Eubacteriaceae bacterium]